MAPVAVGWFWGVRLCGLGLAFCSLENCEVVSVLRYGTSAVRANYIEVGCKDKGLESAFLVAGILEGLTKTDVSCLFRGPGSRARSALSPSKLVCLSILTLT